MSNLHLVSTYLITSFGFLLPFSVAANYMILGILFILWIVKAELKETYEIIKESPLAKWCVVWLILHILGIVWLENVAEASTTIKKPIYLALVPLLMTLFKVQFANLAVNVFLTAIFIYHILVFGIHFDLWTIEPMQWGGTPFINRVHYSPMLVFAMLLLYFQQKEWSSKLQKCSWLIQISFLSSLIITEGRTGQILLVIMIVVLLYLETAKKIHFIIGVCVCMIGIGGIALTSETFSNRFLEIKTSWESLKKEGNTHSSVGERIHHLDASIRLIKESPWIGFGTGSYRSEHQRLIDTYYPPGTINTDHPHNQFLQTSVQFGLFGLIILLLLLPVLLQAYKIFPNHKYRSFLILYPLGYFFTLLTDDFLYGVPSLSLFIFLSTILYHPDWKTFKN